jgi:hypothetical protein
VTTARVAEMEAGSDPVRPSWVRTRGHGAMLSAAEWGRPGNAPNTSRLFSGTHLARDERPRCAVFAASPTAGKWRMITDRTQHGRNLATTASSSARSPATATSSNVTASGLIRANTVPVPSPVHARHIAADH